VLYFGKTVKKLMMITIYNLLVIPLVYAQNEINLKKITEDIKQNIDNINLIILGIKKSLEERTEEIKNFKESITKTDAAIKSISERVKELEEKTKDNMERIREYERKIEESRRQIQTNLMIIKTLGILAVLSTFISIIALIRAEKKRRSRTLRF